MNASAPAAPAAPSTSTHGTGGVSARAAALKASLEAVEGPATSEPGDESSATPASPGEASSPSDSGAGAPVQAAPNTETSERMKRIEAVRKRDEAERQRRQQQVRAQSNDGEMEKLRARIAELEPMNAVFSSEESLLAEAEKRGMSAEKLVQWMRTRLTDPSAVAQRQVKTEADKVREELAAERRAREKLEADIKAERERAAAEREQEAMTTTFLNDARSKATTHPRTARALAKWTEAGLITFINHTVAPHLPERYDPSHLHDLLEDYFEKTDAFGGSAPNAEANPASSTTKNGAGQPATTISNALTSGRESLVEQVPLHKLSREDRRARLKAKLERE